LAEFVKTLPLLEELDYISFRSHISKECLEDIGRCCPLLKSLTIETESCGHSNCHGHGDLFVVGKTMPGLCHLRIFGLVLENDELLTILDGCHLLESLHLSKYGCYHLNPDLIKRCRVQIKDFKILYNYANEDFECQLDVEEDISNQFYLECQLDVGVSVNEYLE
jgi:F-box/leucine-rich repeat protein 2/20